MRVLSAVLRAASLLAAVAAGGCHKAADDPTAVTAAEERQLNTAADVLDANGADGELYANDTEQTS